LKPLRLRVLDQIEGMLLDVLRDLLQIRQALKIQGPCSRSGPVGGVEERRSAVVLVLEGQDCHGVGLGRALEIALTRRRPVLDREISAD